MLAAGEKYAGQAQILTSPLCLPVSMQPAQIQAFIEKVLAAPLDEIGRALADFKWTYDKVCAYRQRGCVHAPCLRCMVPTTDHLPVLRRETTTIGLLC